MTWDNARRITRPSGDWELLGKDEPCARVGDTLYYWCAVRKVGAWQIGSGVVTVPPQTASDDELVPQLREVVRVSRELRKV